MVVIRLARRGRTHRPVYAIVAADSRRSCGGRFLDCLGQYNPQHEKGQELKDVKTELLKAWLDKGATLSYTVKSLLKRNGIKVH